MEVIQKVANYINPMIKLTVDTPCNHDDGKLPVLDVKGCLQNFILGGPNKIDSPNRVKRDISEK